MRRVRIIPALIVASVVAGGITAIPLTAQAISIPVACSETALVAAVNLANSTPAPDTLTLTSGCIYNMTSGHGGAANATSAAPAATFTGGSVSNNTAGLKAVVSTTAPATH
jgi:hypothetical protein